MKKRVILASIVSFVLLCAVVFAGLNAIFTVTSVKLEATTYSSEGEKDAFELQEKLNRFVGSSLTFLDMNAVTDMAKEYPGFRVVKADKDYPDCVRVGVVERKEAFAYPLKNGNYAVLDEDGVFLYEKDSCKNRVSGDNIRLVGFDFTLEDGVQGDYYEETLGVFTELKRVLGEVRANVLSVTLVRGGDATTKKIHYFRIAMREGLYLDLYNPSENVTVKARSAVEYYTGTGSYSDGRGLTDEQKVSGVVTVVVDAGGNLRCEYSTLD